MCKKIISYNKNNEWIGSVDFISYREFPYAKIVNSYEVCYPSPDYMSHDFTMQLPYTGEEPTYREMYSYLKKIISQEIHSITIE